MAKLASYFTDSKQRSNKQTVQLCLNKPTSNLLKLKEDKCTEYLIGSKSKVLYTFKFVLLQAAFIHKIKSNFWIQRIQFNKSVLFVKQYNYATKIINTYIIYDLDNWPRYTCA